MIKKIFIACDTINFKKVKWKISMNILQNLKDEDTIRNLQTKELDKNYADDTNFSFLDDMEIKKLQTIYYWVILAIGIIFYSIYISNLLHHFNIIFYFCF